MGVVSTGNNEVSVQCKDDIISSCQAAGSRAAGQVAYTDDERRGTRRWLMPHHQSQEQKHEQEVSRWRWQPLLVGREVCSCSLCVCVQCELGLCFPIVVSL